MRVSIQGLLIAVLLTACTGSEPEDIREGLQAPQGYPNVPYPSDNEPTTFWITSPATVLKDNVAAGSDSSKGVGIWYLFPDQPVGPSENLTLYG